MIITEKTFQFRETAAPRSVRARMVAAFQQFPRLSHAVELHRAPPFAVVDNIGCHVARHVAASDVPTSSPEGCSRARIGRAAAPGRGRLRVAAHPSLKPHTEPGLGPDEAEERATDCGPTNSASRALRLAQRARGAATGASAAHATGQAWIQSRKFPAARQAL